jgi:hypothetical protein
MVPQLSKQQEAHQIVYSSQLQFIQILIALVVMDGL